MVRLPRRLLHVPLEEGRQDVVHLHAVPRFRQQPAPEEAADHGKGRPPQRLRGDGPPVDGGSRQHLRLRRIELGEHLLQEGHLDLRPLPGPRRLGQQLQQEGVPPRGGVESLRLLRRGTHVLQEAPGVLQGEPLKPELLHAAVRQVLRSQEIREPSAGEQDPRPLRRGVQEETQDLRGVGGGDVIEGQEEAGGLPGEEEPGLGEVGGRPLQVGQQPASTPGVEGVGRGRQEGRGAVEGEDLHPDALRLLDESAGQGRLPDAREARHHHDGGALLPPRPQAGQLRLPPDQRGDPDRLLRRGGPPQVHHLPRQEPLVDGGQGPLPPAGGLQRLCARARSLASRLV